MSFSLKLQVFTFVEKINTMKLRKEVAAKYQMKTIRPGKYNFPEFGTIDLREINLQRADDLVAKGFPFLVLREKPIEITNKEPEKPEQKTEITQTPAIPVIQLRKNKSYINKLLSMNWSDLAFTDKVIFDKSERSEEHTSELQSH